MWKMKNYRIKTNPIDDSDKYIQVKVDQTFDQLDVLSLSLNQSNIYTQTSADYGVVVGRVYTNNGLGIPNVRVAIFIPVDKQDKLDPNIFEMYPYETINTLDSENQRYNILPDEANGECHINVGRMPSKNAVLDNPELGEMYGKYYKFTTETNSAGDYMFFGVPLGTHTVLIDADLSDIGIFSQRPYDFIEQGYSPDLFDSTTQFKGEGSLNAMPHIITKRMSVSVYPFWGDTDNNLIGISRLDIDLGYNITPKAIFIGSMFGDNEKNSINKNCSPRRDLGLLCETVTNTGKVEMIRENINGGIEAFNVNGGDLIDGDGNWAYRVPMNLDFMVTDENGDLVPSDDNSKGIPTRANVRFRISMDETGGEGRIRTRAMQLVPHNPNNASEVDYEFSSSTKESSLTEMYWNKIYTVKQFIPRVQRKCSSIKALCAKSKNQISVKDIDSCQGTKNPFPYNRFKPDMNPLFTIICVIIRALIFIVEAINAVITIIGKVKRIFGGSKPTGVGLQCNDNVYAPNCGNGCRNPSGTISTSASDAHQCYKEEIAEILKIYSFEFNNDWINGSLYSFLLKYKKRKNGDRFCSVDKSQSMYAIGTYFGNKILNDPEARGLGKGIVKKHTDGNLYYVPYADSVQKLFATDIYELGAVFDCDWQSVPKIHHLLLNTSYQMPPRSDEDEEVTPFASNRDGTGLLFSFSCIQFDMTYTQRDNLLRICEIGAGLDEDRPSPIGNKDGKLTDNDIELKYLRDVLIYLNTSGSINPNNNITSGFEGNQYKIYRDNTLNNSHPLGYHVGNSLYFYFGSVAGKSALDLMRKKYFVECLPNKLDDIVVIPTVNHNTVIGGSTGSITLTIDGGIAPYTFAWSNGATTQNLTGLTAGSYTVNVIDNVGNRTQKVVTVNEPTPITAIIRGENPFTQGGNTGKIIVETIYGGSQPYTLTVSGAANLTYNNLDVGGVVISNRTAGTYTLTFTDQNGLVTVETITLVNPIPLTFSLESTNNTCANGFSGSLEVFITSGIPPFRISVTSNNGKTLSVSDTGVETIGNYFLPITETNETFFEELSIGTYQVNVKDAISQQLEDANVNDARRNGVTVSRTISNDSGILPLTITQLTSFPRNIIWSESQSNVQYSFTDIDEYQFELVTPFGVIYRTPSVIYDSTTQKYYIGTQNTNVLRAKFIHKNGCSSTQITVTNG